MLRFFIGSIFRRLSGVIGFRHVTRAAELARQDIKFAKKYRRRRFSAGTRPVIRWIKADGLDDVVTKAAIGQATRLFGAEVDYCICTIGIDAARVRSIMEWSVQPVEWWPLAKRDNPDLARLLERAGCAPERFGYWWKWFPERVRPDAPEWVLDGDMVITGKPEWFDAWARGGDRLRVSQDDLCRPDLMYGRYVAEVEQKLKLYSGLISLTPKLRYMRQLLDVLKRRPLHPKHDGCRDMCEQGVIAATFQVLRPQPIPLHEFPFGRAFEEHLDFGKSGDLKRAWGYHFGHAFRMTNPHFEKLTSEGVVFSATKVDEIARFHWLGAKGQWGVPGWSIPDECARIIVDRARSFSGKSILEIGTSRGRLTAMLAATGCCVTTVDHQDRGAATNLAGMDVVVVVDDAMRYLATPGPDFELIVVDFHCNSTADWKRYSTPLLNRLCPGGILIINNAKLYEIPEWDEENGVSWFVAQLSSDWKVEHPFAAPPGIAIITRP